MSASDTLRVAVVQMNSLPDIEANLRAVREATREAVDRGARWVAFPENAPMLGLASERVRTAEPLSGRQVSVFREEAARWGVPILLGSFAERSHDPSRTWNTSVLIDGAGEIAATYRKMHLFDVQVADDTTISESATTCAGPAEAVVGEIAGWRVGLSICYDLRFPELYRALVANGAEVLVVPAAFTWRTGAAGHWETLLRARAIENQCWVVAPAQTGHHGPGRTSWGHSVVVDPWGRVRGCADERPGVMTVDLERATTREVRSRIPALEHRREGLAQAGRTPAGGAETRLPGSDTSALG